MLVSSWPVTLRAFPPGMPLLAAHGVLVLPGGERREGLAACPLGAGNASAQPVALLWEGGAWAVDAVHDVAERRAALAGTAEALHARGSARFRYPLLGKVGRDGEWGCYLFRARDPRGVEWDVRLAVQQHGEGYACTVWPEPRVPGSSLTCGDLVEKHAASALPGIYLLAPLPPRGAEPLQEHGGEDESYEG